tara:strand:- start:277 stop:576 length:300 start_codon:yes stop_codon:yes gene_type:complete
MSETKGTFYLDLSDRLILAREALDYIDENLLDLSREYVTEEKVDPHDPSFQTALASAQIDAYAEMIKGFVIDGEEPQDILTMLMLIDSNNEQQGDEEDA